MTATIPPSKNPNKLGEDIYRALVENIQDYAIFLLDAKGYVRSWNAGAQRIKGYAPEEIIGKHFSAFYDSDDIAKGKPAVELSVAEENGRVEDTGWRLRKDGSRFWANVTITALKSKEGVVTGFAKVTRDMTEKRLTEEVLKQSEERLRLMIESVQDYAIFMLDEKGQIASWNIGAERINGYKANEIVGKHLSVFYPPEDRGEKPKKELEEAALHGRYIEEGWRVRKDGSRYWCYVVLTAIRDKNDLLRGFVKVTRDMTDQKKAEEVLEQKVIDRTKDLVRINKELEQFAYVASHDLQEPLRMVATYVDLLSRRLEGKLTEDEKSFMQYAVEGSERAQQLIRDILEFSQVGSRREDIKPVDFKVAVNRALENLKLAQYEAKAAIEMAPLPTISGDLFQMTQLFQNLLSNAMKYRSEKPLKIKISAEEKQEEWIFCVEDNGIGIAPEFNERIFEIFQRLHQKNKYSGTGIGLAICKKIVERHHGRIWVESQPNKGSCFKFSLPKKTESVR